MGNAAITVYSGAEYTVSNDITKEFFGGNFLFTTDRSDGTFAAKADYLNINLLRYPGGGMTETYFDVNNPDAIPIGEERETLTEFLSFVGQNKITPIIVIPTKNYINDGVSIAQATAEIRDFVLRVTSGEFGDVKIDTFEVGNEYNMGEDKITAEEYGAYASAFALAIKEAAVYDVNVAVQGGSHWGWQEIGVAENVEILDAFITAGAVDAVDILSFHTYPRDFSDVEDQISTTMAPSVIEDWNAAAGKELEIFVSEWNLITNWNQDVRDNYGLAQASTLIKMTTEMLKMGVDMTAIWAIQQRTRTDLAGAEGDSNIRIAGELYHMLSESTVGTKVLDLPVDTIGNGQVAVFGFESASKTVIFLSALDILDNTSPFTVDLSISNLISDFTYVWGEKLSTPGQSYWHKGTPTVSTFFPALDLVGDITKLHVSFEKDYEVIKLVFVKDVIDETPIHIVGGAIDDNFVTGRGDDLIETGGGDDNVISKSGDDVIWGGSGQDMLVGNRGSDTIDGGSGNDDLSGGKGEDILYGQEGDDIMRGGEDNDILYGGGGNDIVGGGKGNDILYGDAGDDLLKGGPGDDILFGGLGNDIIRGSFGNDTIVGGDGDDILWGGEGADVFVFSDNSGTDIIKGFELGLDTIDLGGILFQDVTQTIINTSLELSFGNSSVLVAGFTAYLEIDSFLIM
jgi:Ca2+-binding RTX toxin-like protein